MIDIERLMAWQAFNWLAGNADGHAKNLALLHSGRTIRLAPFYDLVCTRAIPRVDRRLAMGIGGETDPGNISGASHWQATGRGAASDPDSCNIWSKRLLGASCKASSLFGPNSNVATDRGQPYSG